jgi:hypothetical protein
VGIADSVISWIIKMPLISILYYLSVEHISKGMSDPVTAAHPPAV